MDTNLLKLSTEYKTADISGVKVHLFKKSGAPIYIRLIIDAGSRYNRKDGEAHFLEHMLVAGTEMFPTKDLLAEYIENSGGRFSLSTSTDYIKINIEIPDKSDLSIAVTTLDQILNRNLFNKQLLETERGSILAEIASRRSNPNEYIWEIYRRLFFQDTPVGKSNLGEPEVVSKILTDDLKSFKKERFTKSNMILIISGDIEIETLPDKLGKLFEDIECGSRNKFEIQPIINNKATEFAEFDTKQTNLILGFRTRVKDIKDVALNDICVNHLAEGRSSIIAKELRYTDGLIYSASPVNETFFDRTSLGIKTACESTKIKDTVSKATLVISNFIKQGIDNERLQFLKSKMIKSLKARLQTSEAMVDYNERYILDPRIISSFDEYISTLSLVTKSDLDIFIKTNLSIDKMLTAICGPKFINRTEK